MADMEKVIRGLECCVRYYDDDNTRACRECPYRVPNTITCMSFYPLLKDALELLKTKDTWHPEGTQQ